MPAGTARLTQHWSTGVRNTATYVTVCQVIAMFHETISINRNKNAAGQVRSEENSANSGP